MPEDVYMRKKRGWTDWFELGDLANLIGGGAAGFLAGGPVGAVVGAGGAYTAGNIRQMAAEPTPFPEIGRRPLSADLNEQLDRATAAELSANRAIIERQLAGALRRTDLQYGQHGIFRSGGRLAARGELEQAAMRDLATATAGTQLERLGIAEQARQFDVAQSFREAQLQAQTEAQETAMYAGMLQSITPVLIEQLLPRMIGMFNQGPTLTPSGAGTTSMWQSLKEG